jgi:hypothetical protein
VSIEDLNFGSSLIYIVNFNITPRSEERKLRFALYLSHKGSCYLNGGLDRT